MFLTVLAAAAAVCPHVDLPHQLEHTTCISLPKGATAKRAAGKCVENTKHKLRLNNNVQESQLQFPRG